MYQGGYDWFGDMLENIPKLFAGHTIIHTRMFVNVLDVSGGVRESVNKSAASAASLDYVKFQAVIKSAVSAASLRGGRASGRLDHGYFFAIVGR